MPAIKLEAFTGIAPRLGATLLANSQAQTALDVKLQSGELRPWRKESFEIAASAPNAMSIYKALGPDNQSAWMSWSGDVDVVTSPLADSTDYRFYYTGDNSPRKSNWQMAVGGTGLYPNNFYEMGVPAPLTAVTLTTSGGTAPQETRAYITTFVSTFGALQEESAPSPAATITCNAAGANVQLTNFPALPTGHYNITHRRIYRSVTGATGTVYLQVAQIPVASTVYNDVFTVEQLGAALESLYYTPPPAGMIGIVSMPNGMLAGFVGNEIWFCEPYKPHAWPASYVLSTEFPVVGLGVFGSTLVVMTTKNPYTISGTHPASLTQEKMSMTQACVSKNSIAFDQHGVVYASPYGLVQIGYGVQDVITTSVLSADEWKTFAPSTMKSILYGNFYMGFFDNGTRQAIVFSRNTDAPPLSMFSFPASALYLERATGRLFANSAVDNGIYQLDASTLNNSMYTWLSKKFIATEPVNFSALQVNADFKYLLANNNNSAADYIAANSYLFTPTDMGGTVNGAPLNEFILNGNIMPDVEAAQDIRFICVSVFADGELVMRDYVTSFNPIRMPSGFKAYEWEVQIQGNVPVRAFAMATSTSELKRV